jgi:hypothetical protein
MARRGLAACALILILTACCGTFNNVTGHYGPAPLGQGTGMPYEGVKLDFGSFDEAFALAQNGQKCGILLVPYVTFIDGVFSFIGDTATLPYTLCVAYGARRTANNSYFLGAQLDSHVAPPLTSRQASP